MKRIIVASENEVKINAARIGFESVFDDLCVINGVRVESGISDQPLSDDETLTGAANRAMNAQKAIPEADFWIGMEGGIETRDDMFFSFAWVVIVGPDEVIGKARTGGFFLPETISSLIKQGKELGEADDIVFGKPNSKKGVGAVGLLTKSVIDRQRYYAHAVVLALIPFLNRELYGK